MKILCIIPVFNEENRLEAFIKNLLLFKKKDENNIRFLFLNNNSTDNSLHLIKKNNQECISIKKNKGIGYSLLLGLRLSFSWNYDILIHMAGNNKMSPFDLSQMINPILKKDYDHVCGSRFYEKKNYSTNPLFRKISIKILSIFFSFLYKKKITDATCGFRAFKVNIFKNKFIHFNKKKYYTYGYEYYSYGKILISKRIKSCEASVKMTYPKSGNYTKIKPIIDWYKIIISWVEALLDRKKIF
jgi:dolichol-phosphate mannosyltransferase|tara:strand:+ start:140 stop:868 length:729 start_codon:yes stop_codon:yes gene_type:complete